MIINLTGPVDKSMVKRLLRAFNELRKEDNLHIYFSSTGGETDSAEVIIDLVNKNKAHVGITFYGDIFSAAMDILLRLECEKFLLRDVRGMYHYSYQYIEITEGGRASSAYDEFAIREMRKVKKRTLDFLKEIGFTDKEVAEVRRGKDVYFSQERLSQLIDGTRQ